MVSVGADCAKQVKSCRLMPKRTSTITKVGKREVELSNLEKVLFGEDGISKAQVIEYYFKLAPTILAHLKGRPLSVGRFPDGIGGESFFRRIVRNGRRNGSSTKFWAKRRRIM